jgi:hypothetical protein
VKWWLLALPQYVIVGLFVSGGAYAVTQKESGSATWTGRG